MPVIGIGTKNLQKVPWESSFEALDWVALVGKGHFLATSKKAVTYHLTEEKQIGRGYYLFGSPFFDVSGVLKDEEAIAELTYAYVNGPRLNSKKEIQFIAHYADTVSQTTGPEAILAGELEIPYVLLGYGVDYANGVKDDPTPIEVLTANMNRSKNTFAQAIRVLLSYESISV